MTTLIYFLTVFFILPLTAYSTPLPNKPCAGLHQDCTPWMYELLEDFVQAEDLVAKSEAYRGQCYYNSRDYRNSHEHYAALLIETDDQGKIYFNGAFSFFAPPHRYDDWTLESARQRISNPYRFPMTSYGDHSMADYSPDEGLWKFWLSQNPETEEIYLISYWGFLQRGFCRFQPAR
jgi:hypothetical protein